MLNRNAGQMMGDHVQNQAKREPEMTRVLAVLSDRVDMIAQRCENLEHRLQPILLPIPAPSGTSAGPGAIRQYSTPMANVIADHLDRLERIADGLATLTDRIEI